MKNVLMKSGQLSGLSHICLFLGGALLVGLTLLYANSKFAFILGLVVGILMVGFAGVSAKANTLGSNPFTNDPLGWREAKKSYKEEVDETKLPE